MGETRNLYLTPKLNLDPPVRKLFSCSPSGGRGVRSKVDPVLMIGLLLLLIYNAFPCIASAANCGGRLQSAGSHYGRPRFKASIIPVHEADSTYALLELEIPYTQLSFRKASSQREANFDIIVHVFQNDKLVRADMWPENISVPGREDLRGREAMFEKSLVFDLNPGRYQFEIRLSERSSGVEGTLCLGLDMPLSLPGRIRASSLLVGDCGLSGTISQLRSNPLIRTRIHDSTDTVCAYLALYHRGIELNTINLFWQLITPAGKILKKGNLTFPPGEEETRLSWSFPIQDLWLDIHKLEAHISAGEQKTFAKTSFSVLTESNTALTTFFRESLGVLAYIADEDEVKKLRLASPRDRKRLWDRFWAKRDPIPETEVNEYKESFFLRVRRANENFGSVRSGWKTDRGRIYITHGDPDEVTRDNNSNWGHPTEVWYYNTLRLRFVFIDRRGYGEFELIDSTW